MEKKIRMISLHDRDWPEHSEALRQEVDKLARELGNIPQDQALSSRRYDRIYWRSAYEQKLRFGFDTPTHLRSVAYDWHPSDPNAEVRARLRIPPKIGRA